MIRYALVKSGVVTATGGCERMSDAKCMDGETAIECSAAVKIGDTYDGSSFRAAPAAAPTMMAAYGTNDPLMVIDRAVDERGEKIITKGVSKAITYKAKEEEVRSYRASTALVLAGLTATQMQTNFPTLMAMVAVWAPAATTVADQRAALASMVTKVEAGIAASATRLRQLDAIGTKAKEDLRAAAPSARAAILAAAITAINAI